MSLTLHNTLTKGKQPFTPITPGRVTMYCCGVTVYDDCHLGHARSYLGWDVLRRYLRWRGYVVHYVQNFTDVDDKILNRAKAEGTTMAAVSERYIERYFEDMRRLNVLDADEYPRVTEHIGAIHELIGQLEAKGYAYGAEGDVYYQVGQFADYGKLSGRSQSTLEAGASGRDLATTAKADPADFALWKGAKPDEPAWDSPWGPGRPGWHIECSAMIRARLGATIDIHGGGGDLVFPHHENEIAQSQAASGKPLAHCWLHNGMVTVNGEKMSKSLGNFTTIRDLLDGRWAEYPQPVDPMAVRLFVLQGHYRKPLDFTKAAIAAALSNWQTLKAGLLFGDRHGANLGWPAPTSAPSSATRQTGETPWVERFQAAMDDDLNTPRALAVVFELAKGLQREHNRLTHGGDTPENSAQLCQQWQTLVDLAQVLGLEADLMAEEQTGAGLDDGAIADLVQQRQRARQHRDFATADQIRDRLAVVGVTVVDQPDGETRWHRQ
ncbi:cysteine--tRNA ligase [Nodosilinea sp. P-1105]|uniref:cysteine--tRNA ligase n=1 Tax=Nodosilinea sp. P-1105 TaxID=2546229 RepID=UPI00146F9280|nr:cysteine--tRNA ligase [Nodosilinea sp. P-1105]NMF86014.1 cysteine--tRNA ligase [Nodosilinea sp. P-1105]